jgi:CBS domain-containing protein
MTDIGNLANAASTPVSLLIGGPVLEIAPGADLFEVCAALASGGVGVLVVADDRVEGVVSERDVVQALADRRDPAGTQAAHIAHTSLVWCDAEATVAEVAQQMMTSYVRHVLVEDDGELVGVVSARDLLGTYATADIDLDSDGDLDLDLDLGEE